MQSDGPIIDITVQEPLQLVRSGDTAHLTFAEQRGEWVCITEAVADVLDADGVTRTAYRGRKQDKAGGGQFTDSLDGVTFYDADDDPPQRPIFARNDRALQVGSIIYIEPGVRDGNADNTVCHGLEWFEVITAGDDGRLAVLTGKTYADVPFIDYEAYWVTDAPGGAGGIDYTLGDLVPATVRHVRNSDHVIWRTFADSPDDPVPYFCVHRVWLTPGGQFVFDSDPANTIFIKKTPEVVYTDRSLDVVAGWIPAYNQTNQEFVRLVPAYGVDATTIPVVDPP